MLLAYLLTEANLEMRIKHNNGRQMRLVLISDGILEMAMILALGTYTQYIIFRVYQHTMTPYLVHTHTDRAVHGSFIQW